MADVQHDFRQHQDTFQSFSKLVLFVILWVVLLLACMALGLVAHVGTLALLAGIGGTLVLIVGFAVFG